MANNDKPGAAKSEPGRREFLGASAAGILGGAAAAGFPAILSSAPIDNAINVGLVGCGGRGTGAAAQALNADDYAVLTAMADVSEEQITKSAGRISEAAGEQKLKVAKEKQFLGLDAYDKLINSDIDVVLLATPPGFRPLHLKRAVDAGKHIFCEKPCAVDAPGVRQVIESARKAKANNQALMSGFCWRHSNHVNATMDQIANGAIGKVIAYYATYYTNPVKPMPPASERPAGMSDTEWQIMNWYNFSWICGDSLVEQAIHSADKIAWVMGDKPPISCVAVGGRQVPAEGGNIYDHFEVNYLYPDNVRAFLANRQIVGCHNENSDYILGATGACTIGRGPQPRIDGETRWAYRGETNNMYQTEHDTLFASIRHGEPFNDGERMANSTMLGIMGRMAAYTGQQITWEQAMNSQEDLREDVFEWNSSFDPGPLPLPGVKQFI